MRVVEDITSIIQVLGIIVAAVSIGLLVEIGRSDQMRTEAMVETCVLSLISYLTPALWIRWRRWDGLGFLSWLLVPIFGTILMLAMVVHIPNEISIWKQSGGATFIADAVDAFPNQLFNFFFGFLICSAISALIIGLVQLAGLGVRALGTFFIKRLLPTE